jgi:hypothetical protein
MRGKFTVAHVLSLVAVLGAGIAEWLTLGDPDASGIIEEGWGGSGDVALVGALILVLPAVILGVADGVLTRRGGSGLRRAARALVVLLLGAISAIWVASASEMACDGSCIDAPTSEILVATAVGVGALAVAWVLGRLVAAVGAD